MRFTPMYIFLKILIFAFSQKLRKILRKCLFLCETTFKNENLLKELSLSVAQKLGDIYPELHKNINQV